MRHVGWACALGCLVIASCTERATPLEHPDVGLFFDAGPRDANVDAPSACRNDSQCADRFACTVDHCSAGACTHVSCTDCCGAGQSCSEISGCGPTPQACTTDADCMDTQPCTLDACRSHVCQHQPMDALCPSNHICLAAIGCTPRPPDHCTTDADCAAIGLCYGQWSCAGEVGCAFVAPTSCDDTNACTADRCDAVMNACVHEGRDADADHHVDATCTGGDDCDDTMSMVHPGATEACNGHDDDCDTHVDEGCCTSVACTTSCGSAGMTACNPDGTTGACMPPIEICNGVDDDCDGVADDGFDCVRSASTSCTATCGTTGASVCDATCHHGACVPPAETCNGMDDDCVGGPDNGLGCVLGASMSCGTTCGSTGTQSCIAGCTFGACVPPAEICNGIDDNCNGARDEGLGACYAGEMRACTSLGMGFVSGTATCRSDCTGFDTSTCSRCGNNVLDAPEPCDGVALGGATCASRGYASGTLRCAATACVFDESGCTHCGDAVIQSPEQCDGANLGGHTCQTYGFTGGTLRCGTVGAAACTADTGLCSVCGNGAVETGEQCDGGVGTATCGSVRRGYVGTLRCTSCSYDTAMCTWSDTGGWVVSPGINYYCAFGTVSISFGNLNFTDTGSGLSVTGGGINCTMTGASALVTRTFDVSCTLTGGCNETYRLMGTFNTDNTWTGTFRAQFTGSQCGFASCATTTFPASGSR